MNRVFLYALFCVTLAFLFSCTFADFNDKVEYEVVYEAVSAEFVEIADIVSSKNDLLATFVPFGVWEVVDSVQSMDRYSPQAKPWWPVEPLSNGSRLTITENVFSIDEYDDFILDLEGYDGIFDGLPSVFYFVDIDSIYIERNYWNRFSPYSLLEEASAWAVNNLPCRTISVGFFLNEPGSTGRLPDREIFVVDIDLILYNDFRHFYMLRRVQETE